MRHLLVTPCFNSGYLLGRTFDSVIQQADSGVVITYVVVDGGSSDDTKGIVESYLERLRLSGIDFVFISEPDKGMYDAIAKGFLSRKDEQFDAYSYINAGDIYAPRAFSNVHRIFFENQGVEWITGLNVKYDMDGNIFACRLPGVYPRRLIRNGIFGLMLPCVQQECSFWTARAHSLIEWDRLRAMRLAGDYFIWHCFAKNFDLNVVGLWLGGFTVHPGQLSEVRRSEYKKEIADVAESRLPTDYVHGFIVGVSWLVPEAVRSWAPLR